MILYVMILYVMMLYVMISYVMILYGMIYYILLIVYIHVHIYIFFPEHVHTSFCILTMYDHVKLLRVFGFTSWSFFLYHMIYIYIYLHTYHVSIQYQTCHLILFKFGHLLGEFVHPGTLIGRSPLYFGTCPALNVAAPGTSNRWWSTGAQGCEWPTGGWPRICHDFSGG